MRVRVQREGGCNLWDPHWPVGGEVETKGTKQCASMCTLKSGVGVELGLAFRIQGGSCLILAPPKRISQPPPSCAPVGTLPKENMLFPRARCGTVGQISCLSPVAWQGSFYLQSPQAPRRSIARDKLLQWLWSWARGCYIMPTRGARARN